MTKCNINNRIKVREMNFVWRMWYIDNDNPLFLQNKDDENLMNILNEMNTFNHFQYCSKVRLVRESKYVDNIADNDEFMDELINKKEYNQYKNEKIRQNRKYKKMADKNNSGPQKPNYKFVNYDVDNFKYDPFVANKNVVENDNEYDTFVDKTLNYSTRPFTNIDECWNKTHRTLVDYIEGSAKSESFREIDNINFSLQNSLGKNSKKNAYCDHCSTKVTSLWRKLNGSTVCNACGLYYKMHNVRRPIKYKNNSIKKRKRGTKKNDDEYN